MKIKMLLMSIIIFSVTGCFGLKKYNSNELDEYLKENFPNQKYSISEKYEVDESGEIGGDTWSIEEVWDVTLDDDANLKFQVYNYRNCGPVGCSNQLCDNYNYVYSTYYLEKYNKNNKFELDILKDNNTGIYIFTNTYAHINYSSNNELEEIKKELNDFENYLNKKTNKKVELIVYLYRNGNKESRERFEIN